MLSNALAPDPYVLATGAAAVRRLHVLHNIYWPAGRRVLLQAGLKAGMRVADFGCGVGVVTRTLAEMIGPFGSVIGIDVNTEQLDQANALCVREGLSSVSFLAASADTTGLPPNSFDLVYCRFLLLHLPDPASCLREMVRVLKPGGILVVEDGDLSTATSVPPSATDAFADLFSRLGPSRGLDYSLSRRLYHLVRDAGLSDLNMEIHQPVMMKGENRSFLKWSVEEARNAFIGAGLITSEELDRTLSEMQAAIENVDVLILAPRMSLVWARKRA
jgi:2-polyprenyl-3-methyl-5-hydroxy-6-metoxy-1,4-benzoquinol methylase